MRAPRSRVLHGSALLADLDAELLEAVPPEDRPLARRLRIATITVSRGVWEPPSSAGGGLLGLLVTAGVVLQAVGADGFTTGDLVGAGDVLPAVMRPPALPGGADATVSWHVLERVTAAVLDVRFARCTARWPGLTWRLLERRVDHTTLLMARSSLVHRQRAEERLLFVLWELAERWGKVTAEGVLVPIPLRHHQLATLVSSLRPSVTLALNRLAARGIAERCVRGYLLRVPLEEALARLEAEPASASASD